MLVDAHCHLDQLEDPDDAVREAIGLGVTRMLAVSESAASIAAVLELRRRHPGTVLAGVGLHPAWVSQHPDEVAAALAQVEAGLPLADALGEVGLDHRWAVTAEEQRRQEEALERQLGLAEALRKPVNLHSRRCPRQIMERAVAFRRRTGLGALLHWFTHSEKLVRRCNEEGVYVSVGPASMADPRSRQVALSVAPSLLLLETDAPVPVAGEPGRPSRARAVAEELAALRDCSWEEIAHLTSANFARYLAA